MSIETVETIAGPATRIVEHVVRITDELRRFGFTEDEIRWIGGDDVDEPAECAPVLVA